MIFVTLLVTDSEDEHLRQAHRQTTMSPRSTRVRPDSVDEDFMKGASV
jgi:hypothetical protein